MTVPDLEAAFGDPYCDCSPYGYDPIVQSDERAEAFGAGEDLLDALGTSAEFVPRALGGRLDALDALITRVRPVFRRDAALGLDYGVSSFQAALGVWLCGRETQQRSLASKMLAGMRVSWSCHDHSEIPTDTSCAITASERDGVFVLNGRNSLMVNAGAGTAIVVARTGELPRARSHSLLLVDLTALPWKHWRRLPRVHTSGLRGCQIGGLEFNGCPIPSDTVVGELGDGGDVALRAAQFGGCTTMGLALGMLDASLFTVLRFALGRRLYGHTVADIPHARAAMAGAFTNLLALDSLVTVAARAAHVFPDNGVYGAAVKYLVPTLLEDTMNELAVVLGARYYLRQGEHAIFGKHFRDIPALSFVQPDRSTDEHVVLWHLPDLLRELRDPAEPAAEVFTLEKALPPLAPGLPRPPGQRGDPLLAALTPLLDALRQEASESADVAITADALLHELRKLVYYAGELPKWQVCPTAGADGGDHVERYTILLAAAACLGVWRHNRQRRVLADTTWVRAALRRLLARVTPGIPPCPAQLDDQLFTELLTRAQHRVGFCLDEDPVHRTLP